MFMYIPLPLNKVRNRVTFCNLGTWACITKQICTEHASTHTHQNRIEDPKNIHMPSIIDMIYHIYNFTPYAMAYS